MPCTASISTKKACPTSSTETYLSSNGGAFCLPVALPVSSRYCMTLTTASAIFFASSGSQMGLSRSLPTTTISSWEMTARTIGEQRMRDRWQVIKAGRTSSRWASSERRSRGCVRDEAPGQQIAFGEGFEAGEDGRASRSVR